MTILNMKVDSLNFREALEKAEELILNKKSSYIVTLNPEIIMAAQKDPEFQKIINQADLVLPDGFGLMMAAKFLGQPLKERITGVDLTWALLKLAEERGFRIFLLGAKPGVAQKAAENILKVHPKTNIVGVSSADPGDKDVIDIINSAKPDIMLVAYGAPKQEKFISSLSSHILIPLSIGVGGTFDYIAGNLSYAPKWMRKIGLEWLYRLFTQPKRLNRIITATVRFPWAVLWSKKNN